MANLAICAIISKNYLSFARVLTDSYLKHNEGGRVFVLLVDRVEGYFNPDEEKFELITIEELRDEIPYFWRFCFQYTQLELNTAVKPYFLKYLFKKYNLKKLIYFDPDILITNSLDELSRLLDSHSILLTPHLTFPIEEDGYEPSEKSILRAGVYNLGFIALTNTNTSRDFLEWWRKRTYRDCSVLPEKGLFVGQKWIDLAPGIFEGIYILREPGYNVTYWNLHERKIQIEEENIHINGKPLYFFHFSGYGPQRKEISKHQSRFDLEQIGDEKTLFYKYRELLFLKGYRETINWPYAFGYFSNGVPIPDIARRLFLNLKDTDRWTNPFSAEEKDSFFWWLNQEIDRKKPAVSRLFFEVYNSDKDLQIMFPDIQGKNRREFAMWILTVGKIKLNLSKEFLEPLRTSFSLRQKISICSIAYLLWLYRHTKNKYSPFLRKYPKLLELLKFVRNNMKILAKRILSRRRRRKTSSYGKEYIPEVCGVNIIGYISSELGLGEAVRASIRALDAVGIERILINVDTTARQEDKTYCEDLYRINPYPINLNQVNVDMVQDFYDVVKEYFKGKYNIGCWFWELEHFPKKWLSCFDYFNEIWTGSNFCLDSISRVSPLPVVKIPPSIEIKKIKEVDRSYFGLEEAFLFLFIFDFNSHFERKNPLAVVEAFRSAFHPDEKAQLILKFSNSESNPQAFNQLREMVKGLKVKIIDGYLDKEEVYSLISLCDSFVSLHRSEGFGLLLAEAMYLKKPVIATGYSGNMDFMNLNNSFPVKYKLVKIKKDVGPYEKGNIWAEPDISHAAELMRLLYEDRELARRIGEIASEDIKAHLSPLMVGQKIKRRIEMIMQAISEKQSHVKIS